MNYKRVLIKLSGEALRKSGETIIDSDKLAHYTKELLSAYHTGTQIALVIGGGNIWRGAYNKTLGIDKIYADHMGMLATMINAIALYDGLEKHGIPIRLMNRLGLHNICEAYSIRKAKHHLEKGRLVIIGGGSGNPACTTDSAGTLAAIELETEIFIKGSNVDGLYAADPKKSPQLPDFYHSITFQEALGKKLRAMDMTALTMCMEHDLPIILYNATRSNQLVKIIQKEKIGTLLHM